MRKYSEEEFDEQYEDEIEDIYCPHCLERGYKVRLGPKILIGNEPRPDDYEDLRIILLILVKMNF